MEKNIHELNITELRLKKRPLWMSDLGIDDYAEIVGGGGDIYNDRLPPAWPRHEGMELTQDEEKELGPVDIESFREDSVRELSAKSGEHRFGEEAGRVSKAGLDVTAAVQANVSGLSETVKKTAETVIETISGAFGSLKKVFRGEEKEEK